MNEKRVALLIETSTSWGANIVKGIADYALTHEDWTFYIEPRGRHERQLVPTEWDGDGIIARVTHEDLAIQLDELNKPAVDVSWYSFASSKVVSCTADELLGGQMIANHFLDRGFRNYAYCGPVNRPGYSDKFGAAFVQAIEASGHTCSCFEDRGERHDWYSRLAQLEEWIMTLPKPIALLAFNEYGGRQIAEACRIRGVHVPDQVALMGGEHDELTSQITRPPLSTIDFSPARIGWEAASLLARLFKGEAPPREPVKIPPARIIARQSTDSLAIDDPMLVKALEYIRENASTAISVADVLDSVSISRRVLEQRFQKFLGRSPAAEIRRVRVEKAKRLLADSDRPMAGIAAACGFEHPEVLARVFRRQEGITPSVFRKRVRGLE